MPIEATIFALIVKCLTWVLVLLLGVLLFGIIELYFKSKLPPRFQAGKKDAIQRRE
jgi:hypothetical protein